MLDFSRVVAGPACTATAVQPGRGRGQGRTPRGRPDAPGAAPPRRHLAVLRAGQLRQALHLPRPRPARGPAASRAELARHVDVVVENFRPGVMARMGLGPGSSRAARPELDRLLDQRLRPDRRLGAAAGLRAGHPRRAGPDRARHPPGHATPVPEPVSHADFAVAAQATSAVLAALFHRQRTGEGQHVDVSMAETMLAVMEWTRHRGERRHGRPSCRPSTRPRR